MAFLENLSGRILDSIEDALYPPILDANPELAAKYLTIDDSESYYRIIKEAFSGLKTKTDNHKLIQEAILLSHANFMWFSSFFKTLEELVTHENKFEIPYKLTPKITKMEKPRFQPPFHLYRLDDGKYKVEYDSIRIKSNKVTDRYRFLYVGKDLELEDFRDGYPSWYIMSNVTVFESYNGKTNSRIRIDFINGEYVYYVAGASDNWMLVDNIPLEMDDIVSALLYRNQYVDFVERTKTKVFKYSSRN